MNQLTLTATLIMPFTYRSRRFLSCFFIFSAIILSSAYGQDTLRHLTLDTVVIKAYEQNRSLKELSAAVNYIGPAALQRFGPASVVTAVNTTAGVRMEERSPGSYRFNIRGSALRSPFGVRNVKVYFNDIPFTDPGGNTYLNQLGFYDYRSLEIIKGPGSSLYGAGTGGVLLVQSLDEGVDAGATLNYSTGSFGMHNLYAALVTGNQQVKNRFAFQHQQSDGYRNHSRLNRDVVSWMGLYRWENESELRTTFLAGNLFYETPGALNATEFAANPKNARPAAGAFPGAEQARASINQKMILAGLSFSQKLFSVLQHKTVVYAAFAQLNNPAIRNYGRNKEPHGGVRSFVTGKRSMGIGTLTLHAGGELQRGLAAFTIHKNMSGRADSLQTLDDVDNQLGFLFANAVLDRKQWTLTAGSSMNGSKIRFRRLFPAPAPEQVKKFNGIYAPRASLMYRFANGSIYASVAKGFSPPSTTELLPTGSDINLELAAEKGINYDLGYRTGFRNFFLDVNAFIFSLTNTIVQRRTAGGGEYFINAGSTRQKGVEAQLRYDLFPNHAVAAGQLWTSYTGHFFRYRTFTQLANDYSGNRLPGVAPHTVSSGITLSRHGLSGTAAYFFSSRYPLSDANDVYAKSYHLVHLKLGFEKKWDRLHAGISAGADNLLNQTYSLGNDINAAGGRYFNTAPGRNYFVSLIIGWPGER
jgi:iron complex outermembrane recepter protein